MSRLEIVKNLINERYNGNQTQFARAIGKAPAQVNQWINGHRNIGDGIASNIEIALNLPRGFLDGNAEAPPPPRFADFAARLKQSVEASGLSLDEVAKKSFVPKERLEKYLTGTKLVAVEDGENLAEVLKVEDAWLQFGDNAHIPPQGSEIGVMENMDLSGTHTFIPVYDVKLSAGNGNATWIQRDDAADLISMRNAWFKVKGLNPKNLRGMYVRGDSMEPLLTHWDTVVIDIADTDIDDGEIYALFYKGKLYIKELRNTEDGIDIISANPNYDTMHVTQDTADQLHVLGKKVWRGG